MLIGRSAPLSGVSAVEVALRAPSAALLVPARRPTTSTLSVCSNRLTLQWQRDCVRIFLSSNLVNYIKLSGALLLFAVWTLREHLPRDQFNRHGQGRTLIVVNL